MKRVLAKWMPAYLRQAPALLEACIRRVEVTRAEPGSGIRVVMAASGVVRIPHLPVPDFKKMTGEVLKQQIRDRLDYQYDAWRIAVFVGETEMLDYQSLRRLKVRPGDEVGIMLRTLDWKTVFAGVSSSFGFGCGSVPTRVHKFRCFYNRVGNKYNNSNNNCFSSELCLRREVAARIGFFETQRPNGTWRRFHCPFIRAEGDVQHTVVPTHMWRVLGKSAREWEQCVKHLVFLKQMPPLRAPMRVFWKDSMQREDVNPELFFRTLRFNVDAGLYERMMRAPDGGALPEQREKQPAKRKGPGGSDMRKEYLWSLTAARNSLRGPSR